MLYGRRQGKRLRPGQRDLIAEFLPLLEVDPTQGYPFDLQSFFGREVQDVWLEIGFGGGEHLAWQAQTHPRIGFLGCEPYLNGVVKLLSQIRNMQLRNVRVYRDDARLLVARLPSNTIGRAFILFPDPWPKSRHHKRRIISEEMLGLLARVLRNEAELRIATDDLGYLEWILWHLQNHPDFEWQASEPIDWKSPPHDWPATRYQKKAIAAGRKCTFLTFKRRARLQP